MVSLRRLLQLSPVPTPPHYQVFIVLHFCCFTRNTLSTLFCSDQIIAKKCIFKVKHCWSVLILLFCVHVFPRVLFHSSAIIKLQIASYLCMCIASYFTSHQIMWHNKRIHGHGLKITSCC